MEKEGLNRCINFLKDSKLEVDVFVTDRHKQINNWLQDAHPKIIHYYDIWHFAKGMHTYADEYLQRLKFYYIYLSIYLSISRLTVVSRAAKQSRTSDTTVCHYT